MRLKTWFFIFVISVTLIMVGQHFGGRLGLLICFILALSINTIIYYWPEKHLIFKLKCSPLEGQDPWNVLSMAQALCLKAGLPMPNFYVLDSQTPTAFSVGRSWQSAVLVLSSGLLNKFTAAEIEAVIAHELSHIKRLDIFAFGVSSIMAEALLTFGTLIEKTMPWAWFPKTKKFKPFLFIFSCLSWLVIRICTGSTIYLNNDHSATELLKQPHILAETLWKLDSYNRTLPLKISPATSHIFIVNPLTSEGPRRYFDFQPKMSQRIKNIIGYFPI